MREKSRQAVKGFSRELGKSVDAVRQRHDQRRNLDAAARERRVVLEGSDVIAVGECDRADVAAPQPDLGDTGQATNAANHMNLGNLELIRSGLGIPRAITPLIAAARSPLRGVSP